MRDSYPTFELTCIPLWIAAFYENNMRGEDRETNSFKNRLGKKKKQLATLTEETGAGVEGGEEKKGAGGPLKNMQKVGGDTPL